MKQKRKKGKKKRANHLHGFNTQHEERLWRNSSFELNFTQWILGEQAKHGLSDGRAIVLVIVGATHGQLPISTAVRVQELRGHHKA
jgi:hypothetical protein